MDSVTRSFSATVLGFTTTLTLPIIAVPTTRSVIGARPAMPELWLLDQMPAAKLHVMCTASQELSNFDSSASGVPEASNKDGGPNTAAKRCE